MLTKKRLLQLSASLLLAMATMPVADAQEAQPTSAPSAVNPFKQCAAENNITLPAKGSGQKLADSQRQVLHACVKAAYKAAKAQCAKEVGFTPGQGASLKQCMVAAGFKHHRHHKHNQQQSSEAAPQS